MTERCGGEGDGQLTKLLSDVESVAHSAQEFRVWSALDIPSRPVARYRILTTWPKTIRLHPCGQSNFLIDT
jgi:hypothetical protein